MTSRTIAPPSRRHSTYALALTDAAPVDSQQQLALSLFAELAPTGAGIEEVMSEVGFQRNNIFLDIADLSLSARRAIDVAYFLAAEDDAVQPRYEVPLAYFKWLMAYGSNNYRHLKQVLTEGQKAVVQVQDIDNENSENDRWVSVQLLGTVGIARGKVFFEIHRALQPHIKNPESSHFLSLRYVFKSLYARILYDKLLPHLRVGVTPWVSVETLRQWFELEPDSYVEFKRLSARTLKPGVAHITEVTGIDVSYTTRNHPGTKRVSHVSFRMRTPHAERDPKAPMLLLKELYFTLRDEFGLSGSQLQEIINNREEWDDDRLLRAIEYTRFHLEQGKVQYPAGYLMKAIRGDFTLGEAMLTVSRQQNAREEKAQQREAQAARREAAEAQALASEAAERQARATHGYEQFCQLPPIEQIRLVRGFCKDPAGKIYSMRHKVGKDEIPALIAGSRELQLLLGDYFLSPQARPG